MHLQPSVSHPSIYIDTNGQPSALPDVEGSAVPRLAVQSPDPAGICEYSRGEGQSSSGTATAVQGGCGGLDGAWIVISGLSPRRQSWHSVMLLMGLDVALGVALLGRA